MRAQPGQCAARRSTAAFSLRCRHEKFEAGEKTWDHAEDGEVGCALQLWWPQLGDTSADAQVAWLDLQNQDGNGGGAAPHRVGEMDLVSAHEPQEGAHGAAFASCQRCC